MKTTSNKYFVPAIAVLLGASGAWLSRTTESTGSVAVQRPQNVPANSRQKLVGTQSVSTEGGLNEQLRGKVKEIIDVQNYTYLQLELTSSPAEKKISTVWTAVLKTSVKIGQIVSIEGAQRMEGFKSTSLKRTFDVIYFGELSNDEKPSGQLPVGHPSIDRDEARSKSTTNEIPSSDASNRDIATVHGAPTAGALSVPVGSVTRAQGASGHTIEEVVRSRKELQGKTVRVRGIVVKSTSGVMGKTFVHVRDGSGNESSNDFDLTITTNEEASIGAKLLFEGVVAIDRDFGSGYRYPVLVEHARTVNE